MEASGYAISGIVPLHVERSGELAEMYVLSPFVWREGNAFKLLLRAVPRCDDPAKKIARIYAGRSQDGLHFSMSTQPAIAPGPDDDDIDGCEDPTVAFTDGIYYIYYSGWNQRSERGQLLLATGPDLARLEKRGVAIAYTPDRMNPKEATIVRARDGSWRLFFEYAGAGASRIGVASGPSPSGPWAVAPPPFEARPGNWDAWHLSTGPITRGDSARPIMFYNGASKQADWRIGWVVFDETYDRVVARSGDALIAPPAKREAEATDIAFAASAVESAETIELYYSVSDETMLRATLRRL